MSVADPMRPATSINAELKSEHNVCVSNRTVRGRLIAVGLHGRHAVKKLSISKENRRSRLAFAKQFKDWTLNE